MKKRLALPILIVTVLILGALWLKGYAWNEQGTYYLQDIQGDRSALDDVVIRGELKDGYHRTQFALTSSMVDTNTEVYSIPHFTYSRRYSPGMAKIFNGVEYEIHGRYNHYQINYRDRRNPDQNNSGSAKVRTSVSYEGPYKENSVSYTNVAEYGLAQVDEKIYFTVPTTKDYTGDNGIYELNFSDVAYPIYSNETGEEARTVTTFSLDQNKADNAPSIDVLGLEGIGDKLALILVEGDSLVIRGYDIQGVALGEAVVPNFSIPRGKEEPSFPNAEVHSERYDAFSDPEEMILNLSFRSRRSTQEEELRTIISVDFSANGVQIVDTAQGSFKVVGGLDRHNSVDYMRYIEGKLFVVKTQSEEIEQNHLAKELHNRLHIFVYESGMLIYQGEFITDKNDDLIRAMNQREGYGYNQWEHRFYDQIKVERGK